MFRRIFIVFALIVAFLAYWFVFRTLYAERLDTQRSSADNHWMEKGFSVAIVWPERQGRGLPKGVEMALAELNARETMLKNKIRLRIFTVGDDDDGSIARKVVSYPDVIAVIGHEASDAAVRASITYERHGVLYFAPKATDTRLTDHQFSRVFRLTPDDHQMALALAQFATGNGWKRIGVLSGRVPHGQAASDQFVSEAKRLEIVIPFMRSFFHQPAWESDDFRPGLVGLMPGPGTTEEARATMSFDAIMMAEIMPWGARLLKDMRIMGMTQPVLATDAMDSDRLWSLAGAASNDVYVASAVDPSAQTPAYLEFRKHFAAFTGFEPNYGASQGYEALNMLVEACLKSGSADPVVVATTLKTNLWKGVFDDFSFDENGNITGRDISIKLMRNGTFVTVTVEKAPEILLAKGSQ